MNKHHNNNSVVTSLLYDWICSRVTTEEVEWLKRKIDLVRNSSQKKDIYLAFSSASRFINRKNLNLSEAEKNEAVKARSGWTPKNWTTDQATRVLLILSIPTNDFNFQGSVLKQLFETAEVAELTALYSGLPLYPFPEELKPRTIEGFRTNMNVVFNAIAQDNPYPKEYLDEPEWNQMVLKAIFINSPIYKIQGIDERANATLAKILSDFAHERWAAGRQVTPELWRSIGPFLDEKIIEDLKQVIDSRDTLEKEAAALALSESNFPPAQALIRKYPELVDKIESKEITWERIGKDQEGRIK